MKVDCWLSQPTGTPIPGQLPGRLGVTFVVYLETDVLRPIHICIECVVTLLADVQPTFNTLVVVFATADTTRFARVALIDFYDLDSLTLCFVFEDAGESVKRPPM